MANYRSDSVCNSSAHPLVRLRSSQKQAGFCLRPARLSLAKAHPRLTLNSTASLLASAWFSAPPLIHKFVTFPPLRTPMRRLSPMSTPEFIQIRETEAEQDAQRIGVRRFHWAEYSIEAILLGLFMVSACLFTMLFQLPSSPVRVAIPSSVARRVSVGLAMSLTAIALIYSPWGQRSGAHMNPSVTLAFARLRRINSVDAIFYIVFQFFGAVLGVLLVALVARMSLADPSVRYAATIPGPGGVLVAATGEFVISFLQMTAVLTFSNHPRLNRLTGLIAGVLVATYIALESPFSGMSMNPARTFGSAVPSGIWQGFAIYLLVPPFAMLAAAQLHVWTRGTERAGCCKLDHSPKVDCIFCGMKGTSDE